MLSEPLSIGTVQAPSVPGSERRIRILIADDHPVIRKMVRAVLETRPDYEVSGEAMDGAQAVEQARTLVPDAVILSITMPIMNGFEAAREIKICAPHAAVVILSTHPDKVFVEQAKQIGVDAYIEKSQAGKALIRTIDAALRGEHLFVLA